MMTLVARQRAIASAATVALSITSLPGSFVAQSQLPVIGTSHAIMVARRHRSGTAP